jgi:sterol desaturase/sphingolipid hydroxylase (fatty acid hydroxylase superfamily)
MNRIVVFNIKTFVTAIVFMISNDALMGTIFFNDLQASYTATDMFVVFGAFGTIFLMMMVYVTIRNNYLDKEDKIEQVIRKEHIVVLGIGILIALVYEIIVVGSMIQNGIETALYVYIVGIVWFLVEIGMFGYNIKKKM